MQDRDSRIEGLTAEKGALEAYVGELEERAAGRDGEIAALAGERDVLADRADKLAGEAREKDEKIAALTDEIGGKDGKIAALEAESADKDEKIASLTAENADKDEKIAALEERAGQPASGEDLSDIDEGIFPATKLLISAFRRNDVTYDPPTPGRDGSYELLRVGTGFTAENGERVPHTITIVASSADTVMFMGFDLIAFSPDDLTAVREACEKLNKDAVYVKLYADTSDNSVTGELCVAHASRLSSDELFGSLLDFNGALTDAYADLRAFAN